MENLKNNLNDFSKLYSGGHLFAFSGLEGKTDFNNGLVIRTSFQGTGLEFKLPTDFSLNFSAEKPEECIQISDAFYWAFPKKNSLETISICGVLVDAYHLLLQWSDPTKLLNMDWTQKIPSDFSYTIAHNQCLIGLKSVFNPEYLKQDSVSLSTEKLNWLKEQYRPSTLTNEGTKAWLGALSQLKGMIYSPEGLFTGRFSTPDRWPHRKTWLWDSVFHAMGIRHMNLPLAKEILEAVLDMQQADGFLPISATPYQVDDQTQPPLMCLGVGKLLSHTLDLEWLAKIYPKLCRYIEWDLANRDRDNGGLLEWNIEENENCRSGESGMDNSPRFDGALNLDATDFNAFLSRECRELASFAKLLGKHEESIEWQIKHEKLNSLINEKLWNFEAKLYCDFDPATKKQSQVLASAGFLPLLCGAPTKEQAQLMVRHFSDPNTFDTTVPVASIAANQPQFYQKDMWRGPVWMNINWCIYEGLLEYGFEQEAQKIRRRSIQIIEKYYGEYGTFFEFFDDRDSVAPPKLMRKGKCAPEISPFHQAFFDFGWTAALYTDFVVQESL